LVAIVLTSYGILAFLRRNLNKCSKEVKEKAYTTLVRPNLEYGSSVWDPFRQYQIDAVEMVQRRAARFVTGQYNQCHWKVAVFVAVIITANWNKAVTVLSSCGFYGIGWYLESVDVVYAFVEVSEWN
jgi:hypothetical protein